MMDARERLDLAIRRYTGPCQITRDITVEECPWLHAPLSAGDVVYKFYGVTYGCVGWDGTAMSLEPNKNPFFEVPNNAWEEMQ